MTPLTTPEFTARILSTFGQAGQHWLETLPARLDACAARWSLTLLPPFPLSYNYVAPAVRADGSEVVLKLGVPNDELTSEIAALRHYAGRGAVRLLVGEPETGILLLERLHPGNTLLAVGDDEKATRIAAQVMQELWRPTPADTSQFITVAQWAKGLGDLRTRYAGGAGPFPPHLVDRAERLFDELQHSAAAPVVLHGDLHPLNILQAADGRWLAIDPKGVVGEPAYEVGAWLRNPFPELLQEPHPRELLARRIDLFAEHLGIDRERLVGWGIAQAVLLAWWDVDEGDGAWARHSLAVAELLTEIRTA